MVYRVSRKTFAPSENCRLRLTPLEDFPPAASRHAGKCECTRRFSPAQGKNGRILLLGVKIHLAFGSLANGLAKKDAGGTQDETLFVGSFPFAVRRRRKRAEQSRRGSRAQASAS